MSAPTFTTGPWEYGFPTLNGQEIREADCQVSAQGALIANVSHGAIYPAEPHGSQQREANARLIAAAPELYEALDALSLVVGLTAFKHEGQRAPLQDAVDAARAALAKARGESNG